MTNDLINNTAWLAGYDCWLRGGPCPWKDGDDESARLGWLAARRELAEGGEE